MTSTDNLLTRVTRSQFVSTPREAGDKFAGTFVAKADALDLWPTVVGILDDDNHVRAAISVRLSKRAPVVANLQLLHTFAVHRRLGLARSLVLLEYYRVSKLAEYFRVSSEEDAVGFYRSLGLKFWGTQKSGSFLCVHRIRGQQPMLGAYDPEDVLIKHVLKPNSPLRGSLVNRFEEPR